MPAQCRRTLSTDHKGQQRRAADRDAPRLDVLGAGLGIVLLLAPFSTALGAETPQYAIRLAQVPQGTSSARVTVPSTLIAQPASQIMLEISVAPLDSLPSHSFIRIKGLPPAVSLSEGHAISPGAWAVSLKALPSLRLNVPTGLSGRSEFTVSLVSEDGSALAEAVAALIVAPAPVAAPPPERKVGGPAATESKGSSAAIGASAGDRPKPQVLTPQQRETAEKMVARGEADLEQGNIALARQFFLRAAEAGFARGALLLAATYDPRELERLRTQGVQANPSLARQWYERARELGAPEAEERLARLGSP